MRGSLPGKDVDQNNNENTVRTPSKQTKVNDEENILLKRTDICPVCGAAVSSSGVKSDRAIMSKIDTDLFIRYKNIDLIKYRIIGCPECGYAAMDTDFPELTKKQLNSIKASPTAIPVVQRSHPTVISYEEAFRLYRAALSYSLIKGGTNSERGSIALHTAWLIRSLRERDDSELYFESDRPFKCLCTEETEKKYLKYALQYLMLAGKTEAFPICGMDAAPYNYLLSSLCYKTGKSREAYRYVIEALHDKSIGNKIRSLAEDLKDLLKQNSS